MMNADERQLFTDALRGVVDAAGRLDLDQALEGLGWADALDADARTAVSVLFELQGAAGSTSSALETILLSKLGIDVPTGTGFVLPDLGSAKVPGSTSGPEGSTSPGCARAHGIGLRSLPARESAVVIAERDGSRWWAIAPVSELQPSPVVGLDPALGLVTITVDRVAVDAWLPVEGSWDDAVAAGRLALGHELVGAMRTMLDQARSHAIERIQFGRPISTFQAVRHRLADTLVAVEAADAALDGAWECGTPLTAALAKAVAGRSSRTVRRHCQQVLAGIGFTTEHDLHLFIRRAMVLDALLGDARSLTRQIGAQAISQGHVDHVLPL